MFKKIREKDNLILLAIYMGVLIIYHLLIREYGGDTFNFYSKQMGGHPTFARIFEIMKECYYGLNSDGTSRVIIEIPLFILTNGMHIVLWSVANIVLHLLLMVSLMRLTDFKCNRLLLCLLLIYPVYDMCSAGWITTYISYFWPLAIGCTALISLKKMYDGERIGIAEGVFYILCEIYSVNLEICLALYTGVLALFFADAFIRKRYSTAQRLYAGLQGLICIASLIFTFTCPGNSVRTASNISYWFPDYLSLTVVDKIVIGVNTVTSELINHNLLWLLFCLLLFAITLSRHPDCVWKITLAGIPAAAVALRTVLTSFGSGYMQAFEDLFDIYSGAARVDATNYNSFAAYMPFVYHMMILIIVFYLLVDISEDAWSGLAYVYLFALGYATRFVLAFSPSVYASGRRTMIVIDYMLIYLMVGLYVSHRKELIRSAKIRTAAVSTMYLMTVFSVINGFIAVCAEYF